MKKIVSILTILALISTIIPTEKAFAQQNLAELTFENFVYQIYPENKDTGQPEHIRILSYTGNESDIVVPDEINGVKVTGFSMEFFHPEKIKNLAFPESLKTLGNVLDMNEESELFTELSSLETIEVDKGNKYYGSEHGVLYNLDGETTSEEEKEKVLICYPRKKAGTEFFIDGTTQHIARFAFYKNANLKTVKIGKNVKYLSGFSESSVQKITFQKRGHRSLFLQPHAFEKCLKLTEINLPKGTKGIGEAAFKGCTALKEIALPDGMRYIAKEGFTGCSALKNITLKDGLEEIGEQAFAYCKAVKKITIPYSVCKIGAGAFNGCKAKLSKWSLLKKKKDESGKTYYEICIAVKKSGKIGYYKISQIGAVRPAKETVRLKKGAKKKLVTKLYDTKYRYIGTMYSKALRYTSSKKNVVSVNKNGMLTAKKKGTAVIHATGYAKDVIWDYEVEIRV